MISKQQETEPYSPVLLIHGGAGSSSPNFTIEKQEQYLKALTNVLKEASKFLIDGKSALDITEYAVKLLEDDPLFNAGKGSVFNIEGYVECEASIMDGKDMNAGACTMLEHVKNPICLARVVMEKTDHVFIGAVKAEKLAKENGLEIVSNCYFYTQERWDQHRKGVPSEPEFPPSHEPGYSFLENVNDDDKFDGPKGTVGAVCLDQFGNLAAGRTNKLAQRIGDTPLIGSGNYAENGVCAVSGTGHGDFFIRNVVAHDVAARMKYGNANVVDAAKGSLDALLKSGGDGGVIVVDIKGNIALEFNTTLMFRGMVRMDGEIMVEIFK